jgi:methionyl-tRNA formyltransferase
MEPPRILFFGYSEVGYECLSLLFEQGRNVVALFTHEIERITALQPDLILSVYYRNMISAKILGLARLGAFNLHGSLLPKYRGRAPINWAILHGEPRVGMTLHRMVRAADAGAIVDQEGVNIGPRETAGEAFRKVLPCARRVMARQIDALLAGTARETPQDETQATYFGGRTPQDGRIDWSQPSRTIFNLIRAVTDPYPGAFTELGTARMTVWWAEPDSAAAREWAEPREPASIRAAAGTVLSVDPLVVATGDGAMELTRTEWSDGAAPGLRVGDVLGAKSPHEVGAKAVD